MTSAATDRNLLFGVLVLQADLIDPARFAEACSAWAARKETELADLLVERGWLTPADRIDVERLLERKLKKHGGDAKAGLAEVTTDDLRQTLSVITDPEIHKTLGEIARANGHPASPTVDYRPVGRDRYSVTRLHARGGIGQVWVARDNDLGREVALKELLGNRANDPAVLARFLEEAKITGQLEHPNIVPVYELARNTATSSDTFYTMRFIRGRTLAAAIKEYHGKRQVEKAGRLELRELLSQFVAVCNAVAFAHSRGVLHRDLKPSNVVLGDYGEVVVLDWGLAKIKGAAEAETNLSPISLGAESSHLETIEGQALGTPAYMPPEQAEGRLDRVDERSDVYGLGAMLYEILVGEPPYAGADAQTILMQVMEGPPPNPRTQIPETPPALEAVCLKAMARKPADRYGSAKELAQEIHRWLADEPVAAYPEPWSIRTRRWIGRHRTAVTGAAVAAGVAAICFATATGLLTASNRREREARDYAIGQRDEAERQRVRADENLVSARSAVEQFCTNVAEDRRLKQQDLHSLRKKLLATAVPFYKVFAVQSANDPALLATHGKAYFRLGTLLQELGESNDALADYAKAIEVLGPLTQEHPDQATTQIDLAGSYRNRGELLGTIGRRDDGRADLQKAIALLEPLAAHQPTIPKAVDELAGTRRTLGNALRLVGQSEAARVMMQQAAEALEQLVAHEPPDLQREEDLAGTRLSLGVILRDLGRKEDARAELQRATDQLDRLVARAPAEPHIRATLANSRTGLSVALHDVGKDELARDELQKAIELLEKLAAGYPAIPLYRQLLANAHDSLGTILGSMSQKDGAIAQHRKGMEVLEKLTADFPDVPDYAKRLALSWGNLGGALLESKHPAEAIVWTDKALARLHEIDAKQPNLTIVAVGLRAFNSNRVLELAKLGRREESVALAEVITKDKQYSPEEVFSAACALAVCAAGGGPDVSKWADGAMALLQRAAAGGHFADPERLKDLRTETDLDALRPRDDFKKLLADAAAQRRPPE
ncbi:MAG TPA: serine/threonine-protein kinase [Pirellulales bacterium]|jgi:serine/threonine-protein kinase